MIYIDPRLFASQIRRGDALWPSANTRVDNDYKSPLLFDFIGLSYHAP